LLGLQQFLLAPWRRQVVEQDQRLDQHAASDSVVLRSRCETCVTLSKD
jgi:hypothetical protein